MSRAMWVGLALCGAGCLGAATGQPPATPAAQLEQARASAELAEWPQARASAVAFWVKNCKRSVLSVEDCASAQLVRGDAELALEAPESALLSFDSVLEHGTAALQEKARSGKARAKEALQRLIDQRAPQTTWLVVEQDFDDNHKFGPERAAYMLDGEPLGEVTGRRQFDSREYRVLARAIPAGPHRLGIEIHWKGEGIFDTYLWRSYKPLEFEAPANGAVVVSLDVTYTDGGPGDGSVIQQFRIAELP